MSDSLNSILDTVLAKGPGLSIVLLVTALIIVWYRSGSTFLLLRLLLVRVMGVKADTNTPLGRFSNEHEQLLAYRVKIGMRCIRTTHHAQQVIKWAKDNDVNVEAVAACGSYFNYNKIGLNEKYPPKWLAAGSLILALTFLVLTIIVTPFIFIDSAVVQSNKTSHFFFLRKTEFNAYGGNRISISDCQDASNTPEKLGLSKEDADVICKFATDSKYPAYVERVIRDQRTLLPIPATVLAAMCTMFYRFATQILSTFDLAAQLKVRLDATPKRKPASRVRTASKTAKPAKKPMRRTKKIATSSILKDRSNLARSAL